MQSMSAKHSRFEWARPLGLTFIVLVGPALLYFFFHVQARESLLTQRAFRRLAAASTQIDTELDVYVADVLKNAFDSTCASGASAPTPATDEPTAEDVETRRAQIAWNIGQSPTLRDLRWVELDGDVAALSLGRLAVALPAPGRFDFYFREPANACQNSLDEALVVSSEFELLFGDIDPMADFADVFVADATFPDQQRRIIYQKNATQIHLSHFSETTRADETDDALPQLDLDSFGGANRRSRIALGGEDYFLFLQPVHLDASTLAPGGVSSNGDPVAVRWIVGGLVEARTFAATTFRIGATRVVSVIFLIVLMLLLCPFLKLWWVGPAERFRMADLAALAVCGVFAVGVLTLFVLDIASYRTMRAKLEHSLKELSAEVLGGVANELRVALDQLEVVTPALGVHAACAKAQQRTVLVGRMLSEPVDRTTEGADRAASPDSPCALDTVSAVQSGMLRFLNMEQLIWMNAQADPECQNNAPWCARGGQLVKWSIRDTPTLPGVYDHRRYFSDVMEGLTISADDVWPQIPRRDERLFAVERIRSYATGQPLVGISISVEATLENAPGQAPEQLRGVLLLSGVLRSLQSMAPAGMGFAILDPSGSIVSHSDGVSPADDAFLLELGRDSSKLESVMFAGRPAHLDLHFWGKDHLVYTRPVPALGLTLVAFAELSAFDTVNLEIAMSAFLLYALYVGLAALVFALCRVLRGGTARRFLWPTRRCARAYFECGGALVFLLIGAFGLTTGPLAGSRWTPVVVMGVVGLSVCLYRTALGVDRDWRGLHPPTTVAFVGLALVGALAVTGEGSGWLLLAAVTLAVVSWTHGHVFPPGTQPSMRLCENSYFTSGLVLLVAVAVLPAVAAFVDAHQQGNQTLRRARAKALYAAVEAQRSRMASTYGETLPDVLRDLADQRAAYPCDPLEQSEDTETPFVGGEVRLIDVAQQDTRRNDDLKLRDVWPAYVGRCLQPEPPDQGHYLSRMIQARLPVYNSASTLLRHLESVNDATDGKGPDFVPAAAIDLSSPPGGSSPLAWLPVLLAIGIGSGIVLVARSVARQVFGLSTYSIAVEETTSLHLATGESGRLLIRVPPSQYREFLDDSAIASAYRSDLRLLKTLDTPSAVLDPARLEQAPFVVLENLSERFADPVRTEAKLDLLEHLIYDVRKPTIVLSEVEPLPFLVDRARQEAALGRGTDSSPSFSRQLERWSTVLADLDFHYFQHHPKTELSFPWLNADVVDALQDESGWHEELGVIARRLAAEPGLAQLSRGEVIERFLVEAEPLYRRVWNLRTTDEKRLLIALATDGLVNPRTWRVAARLARTQLLVRDPSYRIATETFRIFLSRPELAEEMQKASVPPSLWHLARVPFFAVIALVAAFLFYTQQDVFENALGFVAAASAGVPVLIRFLMSDEGFRS